MDEEIDYINTDSISFSNSTLVDASWTEIDAIHTQMAEDKVAFNEEMADMRHRVKHTNDELHDLWTTQIKLTVYTVVGYVLIGLLCLWVVLHG